MPQYSDHSGKALNLGSDFLLLSHCPHCNSASPTIANETYYFVKDGPKGSSRGWRLYFCKVCGGGILACSQSGSSEVSELYPEPLRGLSGHIPKNAKTHLSEAREITSQPSACIMSCANAVNAMLIEKEVEGTQLYNRLKNAEKSGLLSAEVSLWGHQVRLDANDERHPDKDYVHPSVEDAKRSLEFAEMLAELLYVIPAKVDAGVGASQETTANNKS